MNDLFDAYATFLKSRSEKGLHRRLPVDTKPTLNFDHNDTLNLSQHPSLKEAVFQYTKTYGTSNSGSRLLCENQLLYEKIEQDLAQLNQKEAALLFACGFQANVSVIAALMDRQVLKQQALAFTDKCIHASMQLGCQLARCQQVRFHHQNLEHLEYRLASYQTDPRPKFILVESLYGMEGTVTNLDKLCELAKKYQAFLYVDEAHAFGVYGEHGGGFTAGYSNINLVLGTFSKALGSFGGFITCSESLKDYLINRCQGLIYTTALPPNVLGSQQAALSLLTSMNHLRDHVHQLSAWWSEQSLNHFNSHQPGHIKIIEMSDTAKAQRVQHFLKTKGIAVSLIRPPTAATTRLRISLNAGHTLECLDYLIDCLKQAL